jgi:hypothetical protein
MSAGKSLLGDKPIAPLRVFVWNGEDPSDELVRRTTAACQHHGVTAPEIDGNLFLVSGRDLPIKIIRGERHGVTVAQPAIDWIVKLLRENKVDVLVIDPFVTTHDAPENDNTAMNAAVSAWREVADRANCSILLVHHVSKAAALDGDSQGIYGSRGGGALIDGVRNARVLVRMTKDEASRFGIQEKDRWQYFRVQNGKSNLAPSAEAVWRRMVGVPLHNGSGNWPDGDVVGVAEEWVPAKSTSILPAGSLSRVQDAIVQATDAPRADERAEHWVGYLVADVLHMDIGVPGGRKSQRTDEQNLGRAQIRQWVVAWLAEGFLIQVDGRREKGGPTTMIAVGIKEPDAPRTDQPPAA